MCCKKDFMFSKACLFHISLVCAVGTQKPANSTMELRRRDTKQLRKRMTSLVHENLMLMNNIRDAESAIRTSARYEQIQPAACRLLKNSSRQYDILFTGYHTAVFISARISSPSIDNCSRRSWWHCCRLRAWYRANMKTASLSYDQTYLFTNESVILSAIIVY